MFELRTIVLGHDSEEIQLKRLKRFEAKYSLKRFDILARIQDLVPFTSSIEIVKQIITIFTRKLVALLEKLNVLDNTELSQEALKCLKLFWSLCSSQQNAISSSQLFGKWDSSLLETVTPLASIFVDLSIVAHRHKENQLFWSKKLYSWLILDIPSRAVRVALLEVTGYKKKGADIVIPLLRKVLSEPFEGDSNPEYLLHFLLLKKWEGLKALSDIVEKSKSLEAPSSFLDWLKTFWKEASDYIPDDKSLKGRMVCQFMLDLDTDEVLESLTDILQMAVFPDESQDCTVNGSDAVRNEPLFMVDKKGTSKSKKSKGSHSEKRHMKLKKRKASETFDGQDEKSEEQTASDELDIVEVDMSMKRKKRKIDSSDSDIIEVEEVKIAAKKKTQGDVNAATHGNGVVFALDKSGSKNVIEVEESDSNDVEEVSDDDEDDESSDSDVMEVEEVQLSGLKKTRGGVNRATDDNSLRFTIDKSPAKSGLKDVVEIEKSESNDVVSSSDDDRKEDGDSESYELITSDGDESGDSSGIDYTDKENSSKPMNLAAEVLKRKQILTEDPLVSPYINSGEDEDSDKDFLKGSSRKRHLSKNNKESPFTKVKAKPSPQKDLKEKQPSLRKLRSTKKKETPSIIREPKQMPSTVPKESKSVTKSLRDVNKNAMQTGSSLAKETEQNKMVISDPVASSYFSSGKKSESQTVHVYESSNLADKEDKFDSFRNVSRKLHYSEMNDDVVFTKSKSKSFCQEDNGNVGEKYSPQKIKDSPLKTKGTPQIGKYSPVKSPLKTKGTPQIGKDSSVKSSLKTKGTPQIGKDSPVKIPLKTKETPQIGKDSPVKSPLKTRGTPQIGKDSSVKSPLKTKGTPQMGEESPLRIGQSPSKLKDKAKKTEDSPLKVKKSGQKLKRIQESPEQIKQSPEISNSALKIKDSPHKKKHSPMKDDVHIHEISKSIMSHCKDVDDDNEVGVINGSATQEDLKIKTIEKDVAAKLSILRNSTPLSERRQSSRLKELKTPSKTHAKQIDDNYTPTSKRSSNIILDEDSDGSCRSLRKSVRRSTAAILRETDEDGKDSDCNNDEPNRSKRLIPSTKLFETERETDPKTSGAPSNLKSKIESFPVGTPTSTKKASIKVESLRRTPSRRKSGISNL